MLLPWFPLSHNNNASTYSFIKEKYFRPLSSIDQNLKSKQQSSFLMKIKFVPFCHINVIMFSCVALKKVNKPSCRVFHKKQLCKKECPHITVIKYMKIKSKMEFAWNWFNTVNKNEITKSAWIGYAFYWKAPILLNRLHV